MESTFKMGRLFGIPVGVHYSWFLVFFMFTFLLSDGMSTGARGWLLAGGTSLIFFASVLAHELAHSVVALARGIPVRSITLFIFGGVAQITREASRPSTEFLIAIAGPLCSLALAGVFWGIHYPLAGVSRELEVMAAMLAFLNLGVGVFNLAPGFPLDGGRVFRAILWAVTHNYRMATKIAIRAGQGMAVLLIAAGIVVIILESLQQGVWTILIGLFLGSAAFSSYRQFQQRESLKRRVAGEVMSSACVPVPASMTLAQMVETYGRPSADALFLVTEEGRPVGLLTGAVVDATPKGRRSSITAASLAMPLDQAPTATPQADALSVLEMMEEKNGGPVLIVSNGSLLGYIGPAQLHLPKATS